MSTLANSEDPDEMLHYAALLCKTLGIEMHRYLESTTCHPFK